MSARSDVAPHPCDHCGGLIPHRPASHVRTHMYCSQRCYYASDLRSDLAKEMVRKRYPGGRVEMDCDHCGSRFSKERNQIRKHNYCSMDCYHTAKRSLGIRSVNRDGYVVIFVGKGLEGVPKSGRVLEHRWVMQQALGRPLYPHENVHHINGMRDDNRLENLELWTRSQPLGQRVEDKLAWAREFIAQYEAQS